MADKWIVVLNPTPQEMGKGGLRFERTDMSDAIAFARGFLSCNRLWTAKAMTATIYGPETTLTVEVGNGT
jgi:hypothetical protein